MSYKSKWPQEKAAIIFEFSRGLEPVDLYKRYPEIPPSNLRYWYKKYIAENEVIVHESNREIIARREREKAFKELGELVKVCTMMQRELPVRKLTEDLIRRIQRGSATRKEAQDLIRKMQKQTLILENFANRLDGIKFRDLLST